MLLGLQTVSSLKRCPLSMSFIEMFYCIVLEKQRLTLAPMVYDIRYARVHCSNIKIM